MCLWLLNTNLSCSRHPEHHWWGMLGAVVWEHWKDHSIPTHFSGGLFPSPQLLLFLDHVRLVEHGRMSSICATKLEFDIVVQYISTVKKHIVYFFLYNVSLLFNLFSRHVPALIVGNFQMLKWKVWLNSKEFHSLYFNYRLSVSQSIYRMPLSWKRNE